MASAKKRRESDFIEVVGALAEDLARAGYEPTLVGGMALVVLGSTRVTRDFDFLVTEAARGQEALARAFYRRGLELASRLDERGEVVRTIDSATIAAARLRIDRPPSAHFYDHESGLRVDLLFDFPVPATGVHARATAKRIRSRLLHVASKDDLIAMKEIAAKDRSLAADAQDLELLRRL